jgi:hypothetical protein
MGVHNHGIGGGAFGHRADHAFRLDELAGAQKAGDELGCFAEQIAGDAISRIDVGHQLGKGVERSVDGFDTGAGKCAADILFQPIGNGTQCFECLSRRIGCTAKGLHWCFDNAMRDILGDRGDGGIGIAGPIALGVGGARLRRCRRRGRRTFHRLT